jgi:hypothetical protein
VANIDQKVFSFCAEIAGAMTFQTPTIATKETEGDPDEDYLMINRYGLIETCWLDDKDGVLLVNRSDETGPFVEKADEIIAYANNNYIPSLSDFKRPMTKTAGKRLENKDCLVLLEGPTIRSIQLIGTLTEDGEVFYKTYGQEIYGDIKDIVSYVTADEIKEAICARLDKELVTHTKARGTVYSSIGS